MNDKTNLPATRSQRTYITVSNPVPIFDTAKFEHMARVAVAMADCGTVPDHIRFAIEGSGRNRKLTPYEPKQVVGNCLRIVTLAERWDMDPYQLADCCSIVYGRLMIEGKAIHAVIESKLALRLRYDFGLWDLKRERVDTKSEGEGDSLGVIVWAETEDGEVLQVEGSVGTWKTTGDGSPWRPGAYKRQLRYRGSREWARAHAPGLILGVYGDDEFDQMRDDWRRQPAGPQTIEGEGIIARLAAAKQTAVDHVQQVETEIGPAADRKQNESSGETQTVAKSDGAPPASEGKPAPDETGPADGRAGGGEPSGPAAAGSDTEDRGEADAPEGGKGSGKSDKRATGQRKAGKQASSGDAPADGEKVQPEDDGPAETREEAEAKQAEAAKRDQAAAAGQHDDPDFMADMSEAQIELYESIKRNLGKVTSFQMWLEFKKVRKAGKYDDSMESWPEEAREQILGMIETARARAGA